MGLYGPAAGALAAAGLVLDGGDDDAVADAGGDGGVVGINCDGADNGVELLAGASLSASEAPGEVLPGAVPAG